LNISNITDEEAIPDDVADLAAADIGSEDEDVKDEAPPPPQMTPQSNGVIQRSLPTNFPYTPGPK
jgi:hypothetical protein